MTTNRYPVVIAVDPGATTGVAAITLLPNVDDEKQRVWPVGFNSLEIGNGIDGFAGWVYHMQPAFEEHAGHVIWVVERFTITQRTASTRVDYHALYIIGFLAGLYGLDSLQFQNPTDRRVAKKNLKDWDNPTPDHHANDAAAHLKAYLVKAYPYLMEDLLA